MKYDKSYGRSYSPQKPDKTRCAMSVSTNSGWGSSQCQRKAVCDPEPNQDYQFTTCKKHSEAASTARRDKQKAKFDKGRVEWRLKYNAPKMRNALRQIADGHNDPRFIASEALKNLEETRDDR